MDAEKLRQLNEALAWLRERGKPGPLAQFVVDNEATIRVALSPPASQPPADAVTDAWRDGFPPLTKLDDKPCKGPDGRPIPPMRESDEVLVCTTDGRVQLDHACAIGDGMPLWFLNGRNVIGWQPKPAALTPEGENRG